MPTITHKTKRTNIGYGSIYRQGKCEDLTKDTAIGSVLRGKIWMIQPDRNDELETPCLWMPQEADAYRDCNNLYECATCEHARESQEREEKSRKAS